MTPKQVEGESQNCQASPKIIPGNVASEKGPLEASHRAGASWGPLRLRCVAEGLVDAFKPPLQSELAFDWILEDCSVGSQALRFREPTQHYLSKPGNKDGQQSQANGRHKATGAM